MTLDPKRNFAIVTASGGYSAGDTTISLISNDGGKLPPTSEGSYNLVWWNSTDYPTPSADPNVEIVRVGTRTVDQLQITRAQEGTTATPKNVPGKTYLLTLGYTAKDHTDLAKALASGSGPIYEDNGSVNALAITTGQSITALTDGMKFTVRPDNSITSSTVTLAVDGLTAKAIYVKGNENQLGKPTFGDGVADIAEGYPLTFVWDATQDQFYIDGVIHESAFLMQNRFIFCNNVSPGDTNFNEIILERRAGLGLGGPNTGEMIGFIANADNSGAVTISIASYTTKALKKKGDLDLEEGDILNGDLVLAAYNDERDAWFLISNPSTERIAYLHVNNPKGANSGWNISVVGPLAASLPADEISQQASFGFPLEIGDIILGFYILGRMVINSTGQTATLDAAFYKRTRSTGDTNILKSMTQIVVDEDTQLTEENTLTMLDSEEEVTENSFDLRLVGSTDTDTSIIIDGVVLIVKRMK